MKAIRSVIDRLNQALKLELGAVNQYWVHSADENWGLTRFAKKERAESIEEMHHADRLVDRIGLPRRPSEPADDRAAPHRAEHPRGAGGRSRRGV